MRKVFVRFVAPISVALALSAAACANGDVKSPVAPSSSTSAPTLGGSATGATIFGTVVSGVSSVSSASLRPTGATLTVSIVGSSVGTAIDGSGHFTLQNVPSGDLILVFSGNGVDARVTITGVHANDQIHISVRVNGNAADLDENEHEMANDEAEVDGRIASTNCSANPQTIVVGTMTPITVNIQNARIRHDGNTLTCAQIQVNDRVEVHGTKNGATIVATEVNVKTDHGIHPEPGDDHGGKDGDEDHHEAEVKGTVAGVAAGHACPAFTFTVGSTTVTTSATTKFEHTTCKGVVSGMTVEVKGTRTSPLAIAATKVEKK